MIPKPPKELNWWLRVIGTALILISIIWFVSYLTTPTGEAVKDIEKPCEKPYIEFRDRECCLDQNNNSFCDYEE